ncbi:MAG: glycosyltransferase [Gaiellaceae bacterium]
MRIAFFGSSLVSSYWNGAATYYRGLVRALHARGHQITFYEPDAYERQSHRDLDDPPWATVVVYDPDEWAATLEQARGADVVVKASGVGVRDAELAEGALELGAGVTVFWDVDAAATLAAADDDFLALVPEYDLVLTYGGGEPICRRYRELGARDCLPVYNALDPDEHHPVPQSEELESDLLLLANRLPDREARVDEFFFAAARRLPQRDFVLGGAGWDDKPLPPNVRPLGHVGTADHNVLNCSALAVLNVTRDDMAANGWSPPTRVFEAAGAGACLITDAWEGIEDFLEPGREVLVARDGAEVAELLAPLTRDEAHAIGAAARRRLLDGHTYARRAELVERTLERVHA